MVLPIVDGYGLEVAFAVSHWLQLKLRKAGFEVKYLNDRDALIAEAENNIWAAVERERKYA